VNNSESVIFLMDVRWLILWILLAFVIPTIICVKSRKRYWTYVPAAVTVDAASALGNKLRELIVNTHVPVDKISAVSLRATQPLEKLGIGTSVHARVTPARCHCPATVSAHDQNI
jgi:hypothetical protein